MSTNKIYNIGILCPPAQGHYATFIPLANYLKQMGHNIYFISVADAKDYIINCGFEFITIGELLFPLNSLEARLNQRSKLSSMKALKLMMEELKDLEKSFIQDTPKVAKQYKLNLLISDQILLSNKFIGLSCNLPLCSIATAFPLNDDLYVPSLIPGIFKYSTSYAGILLNKLTYMFKKFAMGNVLTLIQSYAKGINYKIKNLNDLLEVDLQISQIPSYLFYKFYHKPHNLHFVGPYINHRIQFNKLSNPHNDLPIVKYNNFDTKQTNIFISLGTMQNGCIDIYKSIITQAHDISANFIISVGRSYEELKHLALPNHIKIYEKVDQLTIIQSCDLVITHGGLNSILESIYFAKPMIVIPITGDQPANANLVEYFNLGLILTIKNLYKNQLQNKILKLLQSKIHKDSETIANKLQNTNFLEITYNLILEAVEKYDNKRIR
jgi:MGT family glycosyltransferase